MAPVTQNPNPVSKFEKPINPIQPLRWGVYGTVAERRELKAKDSGRVFGYIVKVAGVGASYETKVSDRAFASLAEGMAVHMTGVVTFYNNTPQFEAKTIAELIVDAESNIATGEKSINAAPFTADEIKTNERR